MIRSFALAVFCGVALTSCGSLAGLGKKEEMDRSPFGMKGVPAHLRKGAGGGNVISPDGNVTMGKPADPNAITPLEDIAFTDPDNPDAGIPELSALLAAPKKGPWEQSETVARQRASREGKPLLIWFSDFQFSPMNKAIDDELFKRPEFEKWAADNLIRLRVDSNSSEKFEDLSLYDQEEKNYARRKYAVEMKKRYKVLGTPTLLMLNPSGEVIGRYRGYKRGDGDFTWGQLKQGEVAASTAYKSWRADLEKKGYRQWEDSKGRKVFAKLLNYHEGDLIFMEPDGTRSKTSESRLSDTDRAWLAQQKMLRGIR